MISNGAWNAVDAKDAQILVLHTKIQQLEHMEKKEGVILSTDVIDCENSVAEWRKNVGPAINKEGKD